MKIDNTLIHLKNEFKRLFNDEFDDPNECFLDFMLDLIPKDILVKVIKKQDYYKSIVYKEYQSL